MGAANDGVIQGLRGRSTRYSDRLHDSSPTIPRCYKDISVNSSFPRTARLRNSLPIECFPMTYGKYLLTVVLCKKTTCML